MILRPRVPPRYTWQRATNGSAIAEARKARAVASTFEWANVSARGRANRNNPAATTTLAVAAIADARTMMPRERPDSPAPVSMATWRTAAMSIPKRVPAPTTNASCVASVTSPSATAPSAPPPKARKIRTFAANEART